MKEPKIRFKEFKGEWETSFVGEVCKISTGKSNTQDKIEDGEFPFYVRSPYVERSNKYLYDEEAVLTIGDGVGTGKVFHYVNGKYDLHQRVYRMFDFHNIQAKFFYYLFSTKFYRRVMSMTAKSSVDSVRMDMIANMKIDAPAISEQQRIASFFTTIDAQISASTSRLASLKQIKAASLQAMFPQEGETVPKLRFKGFEGEWENEKIGNFSSSFSGGTPAAGVSKYYGGVIPFIRSGEIHEDKTELFLTEKGYNNSSAKIVDRGTLLYALYGATSGDVAISKIKGAINQAILAIIPYKSVEKVFLANFLLCNKDKIVGELLQGGQGNLSGSLVKNIIVAYPSISEQRAIASYFTNLDRQITLQAQRLEKLKQIKAACLDKMFV